MTAPKPQLDNLPVLRMHPAVPRLGEGGTRRKPYVLRGREEEFTHLAAAIPNEDSPVYVIEGPPGTGKTALAEAVGAYAGRCGYTVTYFDASAVSSAYEVAHRIWTQFHPEGRPAQQPAEHDWGFNLGFAHYRSKLGNTEYEASMELIHNIYHCYQAENIEHRQTRGFVIIIDNAAAWRRAVDEDSSKHESLKALCNTLNDMVDKIEPNIPILTIFAGTPGTVETIQKLTSNRLENTQYFLHGVRDSAIQEIIRDHLRLYDLNGETLLTPSCVGADDIRFAAQECQNNVWHATAIGRALQRHCIDDPDHTIGRPEVEKCIHEGRFEVYSDMYKRLNESEKNTLAYIATAAEQRDNRLEIAGTQELLTRANEELRSDTEMQTLIQTGILEKREPENRYAHLDQGQPATDHYTVTIPTFTRYIQDKIPDKNNRRQQIVDQCVQSMSHIPAWHWRETDQLVPIESMPDDFDNHTVPGQAAALYPEIPSPPHGTTIGNEPE